MTATGCPRFDTCGASVCPDLPGWRSAVHLPGERVCYYLLAQAKEGGDRRFALDVTYRACKAAAAEVRERHPAIRRVLDKAATTPMRGGHLRGDSCSPATGAGVGSAKARGLDNDTTQTRPASSPNG